MQIENIRDFFFYEKILFFKLLIGHMSFRNFLGLAVLKF